MTTVLRTINPVNNQSTKMAQLFTAVKSAFTSSFLAVPEYTVVQKTENYEERQYPETKWVSTKVVGMVHKDAQSKGFRRLFNYLQGENDRNEKVEMTAPVPTRIEPGAGPNCESTFTVSFFIPPENHSNPPVPTNEDVFLDTWPKQTIYAKQFGGFADDNVWISNGQKLAVELSELLVDESCWFTAGYDAPFKMFNRRNEVWYIKKNSEQEK